MCVHTWRSADTFGLVARVHNQTAADWKDIPLIWPIPWHWSECFNEAGISTMTAAPITAVVRLYCTHIHLQAGHNFLLEKTFPPNLALQGTVSCQRTINMKQGGILIYMLLYTCVTAYRGRNKGLFIRMNTTHFWQSNQLCACPSHRENPTFRRIGRLALLANYLFS